MMADDPLSIVRGQLGERIAELQASVPSLSPTAIYAKMDAIRAVAAEYGLVALEGLADCSAHRAMMPGCRTATRSCLEHMDEAMLSNSPADRTAILAAIAVRLH
jgi:hypothetical protein